MTTDRDRCAPWRGAKDECCLIDQTVLPERCEVIAYSDWREVAEAIRIMVVRGAPAIGCTAALGMALGAQSIAEQERQPFLARLDEIADVFRASRPTAVNLFWAVDRLVGAGRDVRRAPRPRSRPLC